LMTLCWKNKKIVFAGFILIITGGIVLSPHNFLYAQEPPRAMWVWDAKISTSSEASRRLIDFCKSKNIGLLYLSAFNFNESAKVSYRSFNALAHENGIKVHALAGDPRWCIEKYHKQPVGWVKDILEFNRQSRKGERFDGIHSDAEPYVLGKIWEQNKKVLLKWYLDLHRKIKDHLEIEEEDMVFGVDIPFWYDDDASMKVEWGGVVKPASFHLLDTIDTVTVMDYRNFAEGPNGSIALARFEVEYADKLKKKVYIGQETKDDVYPEYITFGAMDERRMEEEISKLVGAYMAYPSFAGIAIHHYRSYRKLLNKEK